MGGDEGGFRSIELTGVPATEFRTFMKVMGAGGLFGFGDTTVNVPLPFDTNVMNDNGAR